MRRQDRDEGDAAGWEIAARHAHAHREDTARADNAIAIEGREPALLVRPALNPADHVVGQVLAEPDLTDPKQFNEPLRRANSNLNAHGVMVAETTLAW